MRQLLLQSSFLNNEENLVQSNDVSKPRKRSQNKRWQLLENDDGQNLSGQGDFQYGGLHENTDFVVWEKVKKVENFKAHFARTSMTQMFII